MIELRNLTKQYEGDNAGIFDINLKLDNNGLYFIKGKSGSGKTTLLNILGLIDSYDNGDYFLDGRNINSLSSKEIDELRCHSIGYIFQDYKLFEDLTINENIRISKDINATEDEIKSIMNRLDLGHLLNKQVKLLSGGQKQRVSIGRALLKKCNIILADEPTGNLDSVNSKETMEILKSVSKEKIVVIVSHDDDLANRYADEIIEIKDGKIISSTIQRNQEFSQKDNLNFNFNNKQAKYNKFINKVIKSSKKESIALFLFLFLAFLIMSISISLFSVNNVDTLYKCLNRTLEIYNTEITNVDNDQQYIFSGYSFIGIEDTLPIKKAYKTYIHQNDTVYGELQFMNTSSNNIELISGHLPQNSNEVVVSDYTYSLLDDKTYVNDFSQDLLITGVYKTKYKSAEFEKKESTLQTYLCKNLFNIAYVNDISIFNETNLTTKSYLFFNEDGIFGGKTQNLPISQMTETLIAGRSTCAKGEIVISSDLCDMYHIGYDSICGSTFSYNDYLKYLDDSVDYYYTPMSILKNLKIVGVFNGPHSYSNTTKIYLDSGDYANCLKIYNEYFNNISFKIDVNKPILKKLRNMNLRVVSYNSFALYDFINMFSFMKYVLLGLSSILIFITCLIVYKDVVSLREKKKQEIGTLFSLGYSKSDISNILIFKYLRFVLLCFVCSIPFDFLILFGVNASIKMVFQTLSNLLVFPYFYELLILFIIGGFVILLVIYSFQKIKKNNICYWMKHS